MTGGLQCMPEPYNKT